MILTIQIEMTEDTELRTSSDAARAVSSVVTSLLNYDNQDMSQFAGETSRVLDVDGGRVGFWSVG